MTLLADCGTSWTKILELETGNLKVIPTSEVVKNKSLRFKAATGHLGRGRADIYENELVAMAYGGLRLVTERDFLLIDVGARDTKVCQFENRKPVKLDWNQSCGAATGFTLELLAKYYEIDYSVLRVNKRRTNVTCGVFGIEKVFDAIISGASPDEAVAGFVHGVAYNVYSFAGKPKSVYFSGGLCMNRCFIDSLRLYCDVTPLGRAVLLQGLMHILKETEVDIDHE